MSHIYNQPPAAARQPMERLHGRLSLQECYRQPLARRTHSCMQYAMAWERLKHVSPVRVLPSASQVTTVWRYRNSIIMPRLFFGAAPPQIVKIVRGALHLKSQQYYDWNYNDILLECKASTPGSSPIPGRNGTCGSANLLTLNSSKTELLFIGLQQQHAIHNCSLNTAD